MWWKNEPLSKFDTQKIDLDNLSSIKDIEVRRRLDKLRNKWYYKNDNQPPPPGISPTTPRSKLPRLPNDENDFFNLPPPPSPSYNFNSPAPDPPPLSYRISNVKDEYEDDIK